MAPTFLPGRGVEQVNCTTSPADTPRLSLLSVALRCEPRSPGAREQSRGWECGCGDGGQARRGSSVQDVMDDKDPRLVRSHNRLVDAASALLRPAGLMQSRSGGLPDVAGGLERRFTGISTAPPICWLRRFERLLPHADVPDAHGPIPRQFGAVGPCSGCVDRAGATAIDRPWRGWRWCRRRPRGSRTPSRRCASCHRAVPGTVRSGVAERPPPRRNSTGSIGVAIRRSWARWSSRVSGLAR